MEIHRVTSAGQVSLPARVRRRWGTRRVIVEDHGDRVVLRPMPDDPIAAARGALAGRIDRAAALRAAARDDERHAETRQRRR
jgi:AbrB family looped-hinge helix DNA binding protein